MKNFVKVFADIIDGPPAPQPGPESNSIALWVIGAVVVCVIVVSVIVLATIRKKHKKTDE